MGKCQCSSRLIGMEQKKKDGSFADKAFSILVFKFMAFGFRILYEMTKKDLIECLTTLLTWICDN